MSLRFAILGAAGLCLLLAACAPFSGSSSAQPGLMRRLALANGTALYSAQREIDLHLARGDRFAALAVLVRERSDGLPETAIGNRWPELLNAALREAAEAERQGDALTAGRLFRAVSDSYPVTTALQRQVRLSPAQLELALTRCADTLLERGLVEYRSGRLSAALDTWVQIRAFLPRHEPTRQAISTTETQLRNLRDLPPTNDRSS